MTTTQKLTKKKLQGESKMTKEKKIKVSELPEEEQKALISEAMSLGIQGILTGWGVETLKNKIEKIKAQKGGNSQAEQTPPQTEEQNGNGEQQTDEQGDEQGDGEQTDAEQQTDEELPDGLDDEAKDFLNGKTDELPQNAEEITVQEAEKQAELVSVTLNGKEVDIPNAIVPEVKHEPIPGEKIVVKEKTKRPINGICHICGSKVVDGVCQGCGFKR